jgi:hypothetical protein
MTTMAQPPVVAPDRAMHVPGPRQDDTEANMISWMEGTLGFSQAVVTELCRGQLLKSWREFADMRDGNID